MENEYILRMENIEKEFYGNKVLKGVHLQVRKGEIHALMGENGAGKSTLMNILFGMPVISNTGGFSGTIEFDGQPVQITSPKRAMELGIGMVHQEFMLIPGFTVTENIKVGRERTVSTLPGEIFGDSLDTLDKERMAKETRAALDAIGLSVSEQETVAGMPVGYMQLIEIAREIDKTGVKLLIFDEPTAVLTESEAALLLDNMRLIASRGIAIIFITHRIDEVINVTDSMTILRDGTFVSALETKDATAVRIAELMIGRKFEKLVDVGEDTRTLSDEDVILSLHDLHVDMAGERCRGIDLSVRRGEIFGIGGLAGQGKIGIANGVFGLYPTTGEILFDGGEIDPDKRGDALSKHLAFVSENRRGVGLLLEESIMENTVFTAMQTEGQFLKRFGFVTQFDAKAAKKHTEDMIRMLDIRCTGPDQPVGRLSGGNQQKVCLARALTMNPKLIMVSEPTRGIDIGAKKLVLELLVKLNREKGMTVVVTSSELNELRSLCDRIAIISGGKVASILPPDAPDADFGLAMSGMKREEAANG